MAQGFTLLVSLGVAALAALTAHIAIVRVIGWLKGRALARPNQRSSHVVPTPQGGGIVVVPVAILMAAAAVLVTGSSLPGGAVYIAAVSLAALGLMIVGFVDDMRGLGIVLRFSVQCLAVVAAIGLMPGDMRIYPAVPLVLERIVLMAGLLWFINLFNFMDGIDLISAVETVSIALGIMLLAALGAVVPAHGYMAAALLGAILGFAWWNRPPARLFLGDAGSLPIGFLLGVLLVHVAAAGEATAALLLPLYYLADATATLARRLLRGERVWEAHRTHFYQQATRNRLTVGQTVGRIALLNALLVALATGSLLLTPGWAMVAALTGAAAVAFTLHAFARQHP